MEPIEYTLPKVKTKYTGGLNLDSFPKAQLEQFANRLKKCVEKAPYRVSEDSDPSVGMTFRHLMAGVGAKLLKPDLVEMLVSFFAREENMFRLMDATEPKFKDIWERMINAESMTLEEVEHHTGVLITPLETTSWYKNYLLHPFLMGLSVRSTSRSYRSRERHDEIELTLASGRKLRIAVVLDPESIKTRVAEKIGEGYKVYNFEPVMAQELLLLNAYESTTDLLGTSDNVSLAKVKGVAKKVAIKQFDDYQKRSLLSRPMLMATVYISLLQHGRRHPHGRGFDQESLGDLARYAVAHFMEEPGTTEFRVMLPEYEGFTKTMVRDSRVKQIIALAKQMVKEASEGWLDMSNFKRRYLVNDDATGTGMSFTELFPSLYFDKHALRVGDEPEGQVHPDDKPRYPARMWNDLTWRFVKHYLRLLVALGILEVAVPSGGGNTLQGSDERLARSFVRLTNLGQYAFGNRDRYRAKLKVDLGRDLEIDDRNMIITLRNPESAARMIIEAYGRPIGGNRYHFSATGLVSGAVNSSECLRRVDNLRDLLSPKKGSPWAEMLAECELRAQARKQERRDYILVGLNPQAPGLIDYIQGDEDILSEVVRVEGSRLLVPDPYYDTFVKKLKKAGYLID